MHYELSLDNIFSSLSDPTRRDIVKRISKRSLTVSEIAEKYNLTLAAISKHLKVLENAKLIVKKRQGKQQIVSLYPKALEEASDYLKLYENIWNERMDRFEQLLKDSK